MFTFSEFVETSSRYRLFQVGDLYELDWPDEWYIVIKYPFEFGYDLSKDVEDLLEYCKSMDIKTVGKFGVVGGLLID
jgi:hypothetical protein